MKNICDASSFLFADKYIESIAEFGELVFWEEEKTKLTYRMFHRNVCAVASYIAQLNSPLIALYIQKPLYMTVGIIACLYSGITFIPCGEDNYLHISSATEYKDVPVIMDDEIEDAIKSFSKKELKQVAKNDNLKIKDVSQFSKDFSSIIMKDFRQNITKLFDIIVKKANEIKDAAEKEREDEAKRLKEKS